MVGISCTCTCPESNLCSVFHVCLHTLSGISRVASASLQEVPEVPGGVLQEFLHVIIISIGQFKTEGRAAS